MADKRPMKDMVVILPGILGSILQKDGKDLWAVSGQSFWNLITRSKETIQSLELSAGDLEQSQAAIKFLEHGHEAYSLQEIQRKLDELSGGIRATQLISDIHLVPGLVKIDGYTQTSSMISDNFDVKQGDIFNDAEDTPANLYHFPYDWRRDNRLNAHILKALIDKRLKCWRESSGAADAKVILLAHSMGGLVSRYYLEVLGGWQDARALFTFGTPYRGSISGLNFLANGYKKLFLDLTSVMRSLTSIYHLLPIYPVVNVGDKFVRVTETDQIPHVDPVRAQDARDFHDTIYEANKRNQQQETYRNFTTIPIVGMRQPTLQSAELVDGELIASYEMPPALKGNINFIDGDGTVPKISAIPNELTTSYNNRFIAEAHGALQNQPQILQSLRDAISTAQFLEGTDLRAEKNSIGVGVDDLYLPDESIALRAQVVSQSELTGLNAVISPVSYDGEPMTFDFEQQSAQQHTQEWSLTIDQLPAGLYRAVISAEGSKLQELPTPVHNCFEVVDAVDR